MDRFVQSQSAFVKNMFPSKREKNAFIERGVASLWFNLTPLMYVGNPKDVRQHFLTYSLFFFFFNQ